MDSALEKTDKTDHAGFVEHQKYCHLSDETIVAEILKGRKQLFEVLMRRLNQRLYRIVRSYIDGEQEVKDVLQSTYLKVFEKLDQFKEEAKFSTWITRIAINEALKYLNNIQKAPIQSIHAEGWKEGSHLSSKETSPEKSVMNADLKHLLEKVVSTLPPKYRSVYIMREVEEMNTQETAKCLDITTSNVKVRLHRARKMIREELERKVANIDIFDFLGERCDNLVRAVMQEIS